MRLVRVTKQVKKSQRAKYEKHTLLKEENDFLGNAQCIKLVLTVERSKKKSISYKAALIPLIQPKCNITN